MEVDEARVGDVRVGREGDGGSDEREYSGQRDWRERAGEMVPGV